MPITVENETTDHNRTLRFRGLKDVPELLVTLTYVSKQGEPGVLAKASALDHEVIPAILAAFAARSAGDQFFAGLAGPFVIQLVGDVPTTFVTGYDNTHATPSICNTKPHAKTFASKAEAHEWAASYLPGYSYEVVPQVG